MEENVMEENVIDENVTEKSFLDPYGEFIAAWRAHVLARNRSNRVWSFVKMFRLLKTILSNWCRCKSSCLIDVALHDQFAGKHEINAPGEVKVVW